MAAGPAVRLGLRTPPGQETRSCPTGSAGRRHAEMPPYNWAEPARQRLAQACQEFESIFLGLLLRQMRQSALGPGFLAPGTPGELFYALYDQELARTVSRSSPLGLSKLLMESLDREPEWVVPGTR